MKKIEVFCRRKQYRIRSERRRKISNPNETNKSIYLAK